MILRKTVGACSSRPRLYLHARVLSLVRERRSAKTKIGRVVPSLCSSSTSAPNPSTDASMNRRSPAMAAEKAGKAGTCGVDRVSRFHSRAVPVFCVMSRATRKRLNYHCRRGKLAGCTRWAMIRSSVPISPGPITTHGGGISIFT